MPNILETGGETFMKFSGLWGSQNFQGLGVTPKIPSAKFGGDLPTQFLGKK